MLVRIDSVSNVGRKRSTYAARPVVKKGVFAGLESQSDIVTNNGSVWLGQRRCPNRQCNTHVFVAWRPPGQVLASYPAERIDFDSSNIPGAIVATFEEALTCHANECFTAAAMMVRKTLEQLCDDRGASGKTLHERLAALKGKVILPDALFGALDALRKLCTGDCTALLQRCGHGNHGDEGLGWVHSLCLEPAERAGGAVAALR